MFILKGSAQRIQLNGDQIQVPPPENERMSPEKGHFQKENSLPTQHFSGDWDMLDMLLSRSGISWILREPWRFITDSNP